MDGQDVSDILTSDIVTRTDALADLAVDAVWTI